MNDKVKSVQMVENGDGTARYPGTAQWPMSKDDQKRAGLLAVTNRSIHPRNWSKGKTAKHDRTTETV